MSTSPTVTSISPDKGSLIGNNLITLTGSGFTSITSPSVNFGNAAGTKLKVVSDDTITVINPNTGTPGSVPVTLIDGATHISAGNFNYELPQITGLQPSSSSLEGNKVITIKGKYFTGAAAVNFGEAGASDVQVVSDNEIRATNPNAPKDAKVDVSVVVQGQSSPICEEDQFTYTAADARGVPLLFTAGDRNNTYVQFLGDANIKGSYYDSKNTKHELAANTVYPLKDLVSQTPLAKNIPANVPAILIKEFSGRVYISLGQGLQNMSSSYTPDAANSGDINFPVRYQYFEPTIKNSQLNIDLSYIDFTAISLSLKTFKAPHSTNGDQRSQSSLKLAQATAGAAATSDGSVLPSGTPLLDPKDKTKLNSAFARVISPQLGADKLYHNFKTYLTALGKAKTAVRIAGTFVGNGAQPAADQKPKPKHPKLIQAQSYDYRATFNSDGSVTLIANSGSGDGTAKGVPKVQQGPGVGDKTGDIKITFDALNDKTGIYGCNTPYTLGSDAATPGITNDVYGQVVGDLLSGLNFGYIGSDQTFGKSKTKINTLSSTEWWGGIMPDGTVIPSDSTPGGQQFYFSDAQPGTTKADNYNGYSGSICKLTTGYGFPLQDRLGRNLLTMNSAADEDGYLMVYVDCEPPSTS